MPKLLLADDSPTTQKVVQLTFADEGIEVVVADDGDTAMELFTHHHPDIVLADINIPGLNGYEVCEAIRKRESNGAIPVVLLAGSFEPFDVEEAHRVGANDYLTKPFSSIRRLVATVTALIDIEPKPAETDQPVSVAAETGPEPEPDSEPTASTNLVEPGPAPTMADEPDMLSTSDIEELYTQSIVETTEQSGNGTGGPAAFAPQAEPAIETSISETAKDDLAYDDELIETTYLESSTAAVEHAQEDAPDDETEQVEPPAEPTLETAPEISDEYEIPEPGVDLPGPSVAQSEIPTVSFDLPSFETGETLSHEGQEAVDETTAELDQSGDEAYFEPTVDVPVSADTAQAAEEQPSGQMDDLVQPLTEMAEAVFAGPGPQMEPESEQRGFELVSPVEAEPLDSTQPIRESVDDQTTVEGVESGDLPPAVAETPMPWDSVAEPRPVEVNFDAADLLEIPGSVNGREDASVAVPSDTDIAEKVGQIAPEIVDQIAKLTAAQVSEELVREIANRIVPKVIEEVMARKDDSGGH